jgi:hypothetical protein
MIKKDMRSKLEKVKHTTISEEEIIVAVNIPFLRFFLFLFLFRS